MQVHSLSGNRSDARRPEVTYRRCALDDHVARGAAGVQAEPLAGPLALADGLDGLIFGGLGVLPFHTEARGCSNGDNTLRYTLGA